MPTVTVNGAPVAIADDDSGINLALLAALPAARNVLELGCATGRLARRYKRMHSQASWTGVDLNDTALAAARPFLNGTFNLDLDVDSIAAAGADFDLVVIGDVLEHLRQPERLLSDLRSICTPDAQLVCCVPNMSHISVIERLIRGDIMYDRVGLLDATHVRFLSPRSTFKMLLDAGWLPDIAGGYQGGHPNQRFAQAIIDAAQALGIPPTAAQLNIYAYQLVIRCSQRVATPVSPPHATVSVIVATDNQAQFNLNVARSPGLREIEAEIIMCPEASSAAAGYAFGNLKASGEWRLFCHDDVYFPRGTGLALLDLLSQIALGDVATTLLGFSGLGIDETLRPFRAGLTVEQRTLRNYPATERAISLVDFAVLMHRDSPLVIDPALGQHLWATDLCLQSIYGPTARFPRIARIPLLHNSVDDDSFAAEYLHSAHAIAQKYPQIRGIPTFDGNINKNGTLCREPSML